LKKGKKKKEEFFEKDPYANFSKNLPIAKSYIQIIDKNGLTRIKRT
jgi:hypothetical protein